MKFTKNDMVYIIVLLTLYLTIFLLKRETPIPINKLNECIILFMVVLLYNISNVLSFCLCFMYLLNKYLNT
jgi:hypothetical protein